MDLEKRVRNLEDIVSQLAAKIERIEKIVVKLEELDMEKIGEIYERVKLEKR